MIILTAPSLEAALIEIGDTYNNATITAVPAPGDENRWFLLKNGYVLPGLHILKRDNRYTFGTITP